LDSQYPLIEITVLFAAILLVSRMECRRSAFGGMEYSSIPIGTKPLSSPFNHTTVQSFLYQASKPPDPVNFGIHLDSKELIFF